MPKRNSTHSTYPRPQFGVNVDVRQVQSWLAPLIKGDYTKDELVTIFDSQVNKDLSSMYFLYAALLVQMNWQQNGVGKLTKHDDMVQELANQVTNCHHAGMDY